MDKETHYFTLKADGKIYLVDMPEKSVSFKSEDRFNESMTAYSKAIQSAISNDVEVSNQEETIQQVEWAHNQPPGGLNKTGKVYELQCRVEKKTTYDSCNNQLCKDGFVKAFHTLQFCDVCKGTGGINPKTVALVTFDQPEEDNETKSANWRREHLRSRKDHPSVREEPPEQDALWFEVWEAWSRSNQKYVAGVIKEMKSKFVITRQAEIQRLKEKEIRGDRMMVDLEHEKSVLRAEKEALQSRIVELSDEISTARELYTKKCIQIADADKRLQSLTEASAVLQDRVRLLDRILNEKSEEAQKWFEASAADKELIAELERMNNARSQTIERIGKESVADKAEIERLKLLIRSEKIAILENFCTFLEANGYVDTDWRTEPPFAIDEFLKLIALTKEA
jgi:hypothetical protein